MALAVKNAPANARDARDMGSIPGWGRSPGGGKLEEGTGFRKDLLFFFKGETRALWILKTSSHREEEAEDSGEKESLIWGGLREDNTERTGAKVGTHPDAGASTSSFPHRNTRRSRWGKKQTGWQILHTHLSYFSAGSLWLLWNTKPGPAVTRSDLEDGAGGGGGGQCVKFQTRGGYFREWPS